MMDIDEISLDDDEEEEEEGEEYREPKEGAIWKHRILHWTVVIHRISSQWIHFFTMHPTQPQNNQTEGLIYYDRSRENFLEEFSSSSNDDI